MIWPSRHLENSQHGHPSPPKSWPHGRMAAWPDGWGNTSPIASTTGTGGSCKAEVKKIWSRATTRTWHGMPGAGERWAWHCFRKMWNPLMCLAFSRLRLDVSRKSTLWVMWAPEGAPQELDEGCASAFGAQQCSTSYARSAVQVGPGTSGWFWLRRHLKISKVEFHAFLDGDNVAWAALEHLPFDLAPRPAGLSRRRFNLGPSPWGASGPVTGRDRFLHSQQLQNLYFDHLWSFHI